MKLFSFIYYDYSEKWQTLFQDPATSIMENIIDLHHDVTFFLILISVFVCWMLLRIVYFFNRTANTTRSLYLTHHTLLEIVWTVVPAFILVLIALPSYVLIYNMDELNDPKVTLKISGRQWYWTYEYSDYSNTFRADGPNEIIFDSYMLTEDALRIGDLRLLEVDNAAFLPIKTSIRLMITSSDVIHSWTVPSFGIKMDAVPGRLNQVGLTMERKSVFYGQCSELCGVNHSFMPISVHGVSLTSYIEWVLKKIGRA